MAAVTKAANSHAAVSGAGFTNPSNAYATTGDNVYATATLTSTTNSTVSGDFGFPDFTTTDIPAYSTLTSVVLNTEYAISATVTGLATGIQIYRNNVAQGTEVTRSSLTEAAATQTVTVTNDAPISLADLRTASTLVEGRVRIAKGNTANLSTLSLDYISLTANYNAPSAVSTLSAMSFSAGTISPTFASGTTSYSFTVPYATSTTTFTLTGTGPVGLASGASGPSANTGYAIDYRLNAGAWTSVPYTVSGTTAVVTAQPTTPIPLVVGSGNVIDVRVTPQDGNVANATTYTTTITRSVGVSTLSALTFTAGALSPAFSSGTNGGATQSFTVSGVTYATATTNFTATATGPTGLSFAMHYRVNGGTWTQFSTTSPATVSGISLGATTLASATVVEVRVTSQDGTTQNTYSTTVNRVAASTDATLSALSFTDATANTAIALVPAFSAGEAVDTAHTGAVDKECLTATLAATRNAALASALDYRLRGGSWTSFAGTGTASLTLADWANLVEVRVTAESGATRTYPVTIVRVEPYDFQTYVTVNGEPVGGATSITSQIKWGLV